eukprot:CAMPEP_0182609586 /NCGR_PEP_ID=MMETSP1330-20130603/3624_1 /TAXON_ID=464278 /ORGANISM="Picochlorum sp., Strain RCC944" /LENGTH=292 /DNA_ID=CAMNT_0024828455 /DNA_START=55 /DNA_END=933 /DNA_ORIENTATION=+
MKVTALFGKAKAAPAKKAASKSSKGPAKKVLSSGSGRKTGGWLGSDSQDLGLDKWYGPDRKLFLPSGLLERADVPSYLNGSLAGDYGYDPLGLGKDGGAEKYREQELLHARWAMLFTFGALAPELLAVNGGDVPGSVWFETGKTLLDGDSLKWFIVPFGQIDNPLPLVVVAAAQVALMGGAEFYRKQGSVQAGFAPGVGKFDESVFDGVDPLYPGGPFDPLGLADDPDVFAELKVKEIKNGRLAMVAGLGFFIQALVTQEGPYANWSKHVADPFGYNLLTILGSGEDRVPTL